MSLLKNLSIGFLVLSTTSNVFANNFVGVWKPISEKNGASVIVVLEENGDFDISAYDDMKIKCDHLKFAHKSSGILKNGQVSDELLICKSMVDGDMGVFSLNYLSEDKRTVLFRNIEDSDKIGHAKSDEPLAIALKEQSKNGKLNRFTLKVEGDSADCHKNIFKKQINNNIWNSEVTYFCDNQSDPDTNMILGFNPKTQSDVEWIFTQDRGDQDDKILTKMD